MPRLLAISPHFPPLNAPDMQRLRMSLPHWLRAGWEVTVLAVDEHEPLAPVEPELLETIPAEVRVMRVPAFRRRWTRWLGVGNIGLRALPFLHAAARRLLRAERFDLVYFSTTQFIVLPLGRLWKREFGVPFVVDLQDPWLSDYYERSGAPPPGGWKYGIARMLAKRLEGWTLSEAAHVISVSQSYLDALARRYPWWENRNGTELTFGAPDLDFELLRRRLAALPGERAAGAPLRIVYAGRLGPDMLPSLAVLFSAIAALGRDMPRVEVFFYGTSYAPAQDAVATTTALAERHGIADRVHEAPARIGYLEALRHMIEADVVLLLGSDDPAYSPSKIYPALMADRPVLAVAPAASVLLRRLGEIGGADAVSYDSRATAPSIRELTKMLAARAKDPLKVVERTLNRALLDRDYSAAAIAARQLEVFMKVAGQRG